MGSSTVQVKRRRWGPLAAVAVVVGLLGSLLVGVGPAAAVDTTTTLVVGPASPTEVSQPLTLTATVTPSNAVGFVQFFDGDLAITPYMPTDGSTGVVAAQLGPFLLGGHELNARFSSQDPEEWGWSTSPDVAHTVVPGDLPVMTCIGHDQGIRSVLEELEPLMPAGGGVIIETPISGTVPETIPQGLPSAVSFEWEITIPDALIDVAAAFEAEGNLSLKNIDLGFEATGAASGEWDFPATYPAGGGYIADPAAPIVFEPSGQVTGTSQGEIEYDLRDGQMTVFVPSLETNEVPADIDVILDCTFANATLPDTTLVDGEIDPPDAPTGVSAVAGPGQATVNWTPPADDGGAPVTGYLIEASSGQTVLAGPEVTSIDVIGLTAGATVSFTVIAENAAGFSPESTPSAGVTIGEPDTFSDVPPGHPFFKEISWMAATGLSTGYDDGSFKPGAPLARQAMSAFLYRLNGSPNGPTPTCSSAPFIDVPVSHPFCGEIAWMADTGISTGFDDNTYRPQAVTTRQAMSAFLYRSANGAATPPACTSMPFSDVPISNQFCPQITWMAEEGISTGYDDGTYKPQADLARQAMSAFLYRYTLVVPTTIA